MRALAPILIALATVAALAYGLGVIEGFGDIFEGFIKLKDLIK